MTRRLYVWDSVFCDYTAGCAMAIATSKKDAARQIALAKNPEPRAVRNRVRVLTPEQLKLAETYRRESVEENIAELMAEGCTEHFLDEPFTFWMYGGG